MTDGDCGIVMLSTIQHVPPRLGGLARVRIKTKHPVSFSDLGRAMEYVPHDISLFATRVDNHANGTRGVDRSVCDSQLGGKFVSPDTRSKTPPSLSGASV